MNQTSPSGAFGGWKRFPTSFCMLRVWRFSGWGSRGPLWRCALGCTSFACLPSLVFTTGTSATRHSAPAALFNFSWDYWELRPCSVDQSGGRPTIVITTLIPTRIWTLTPPSNTDSGNPLRLVSLQGSCTRSRSSGERLDEVPRAGLAGPQPPCPGDRHGLPHAGNRVSGCGFLSQSWLDCWPGSGLGLLCLHRPVLPRHVHDQLRLPMSGAGGISKPRMIPGTTSSWRSSPLVKVGTTTTTTTQPPCGKGSAGGNWIQPGGSFAL